MRFDKTSHCIKANEYGFTIAQQPILSHPIHTLGIFPFTLLGYPHSHSCVCVLILQIVHLLVIAQVQLNMLKTYMTATTGVFHHQNCFGNAFQRQRLTCEYICSFETLSLNKEQTRYNVSIENKNIFLDFN